MTQSTSRRVPRLTAAVATVLFILTVPAATGQNLSVSVRETPLRESPGFLGRVVRNLSYGDRVESISERDGWNRVRYEGVEGWVHGSALTTRRIVLQAGDRDVQEAATGREVALAGRGFNQQVEDQYRSETGLDFDMVDRIEGYAMDPESLLAFLEEGELSLDGGGE